MVRAAVVRQGLAELAQVFSEFHPLVAVAVPSTAERLVAALAAAGGT